MGKVTQPPRRVVATERTIINNQLSDDNDEGISFETSFPKSLSKIDERNCISIYSFDVLRRAKIRFSIFEGKDYTKGEIKNIKIIFSDYLQGLELLFIRTNKKTDQ